MPACGPAVGIVNLSGSGARRNTLRGRLGAVQAQSLYAARDPARRCPKCRLSAEVDSVPGRLRVAWRRLGPGVALGLWLSAVVAMNVALHVRAPSPSERDAWVTATA